MRLVALLLAVALPAAAAPRDPATAKAKELFTHAEALYALTKYDQALAEYERAFETKPLPGFLFNIGQCHRNLGQYDKALHFYREYLERDPQARNRELVESLIAETEAQARAAPPPVEKKEPAPVEKKEPAPDLTAPAPTPTEELPLHKRWYVWAGGGAALLAVLLAVGIGFGVAASTAAPHGTLSTIDAR